MTGGHPQPGEWPSRPWEVEDSDATWRTLGTVVHGPVVLARAPGIVVALRCLFAHPDSLSAWLVAHAEPGFFPQVVPPRSELEARVHSDLWEHWPGRASDPLVHAVVDHVPQRLLLLERQDGRGSGNGSHHVSCAARILGLPTDDALVFEVSWGLGLAPTTTTLHLPGLGDAASGAVPLVHDDPTPPLDRAGDGA